MTKPLRATDLTTRRAMLAVFAGAGSARVLVTAAIVLLSGRILGGALGLSGFRWGRGDGLVVLVTVAGVGSVEWMIHSWLLHAPDDAWTSRVLGVGVDHRRHHGDPPDLAWLLLRGVDAAVFVVGFGVITALWTLPLLWLSGSALLGPFVLAWGLAAAALAHYEWTHLLVHTHYRPRSRYYARLARNHRLHHYRNERYWMGVTSNTGDRLFRTYPRSKTDVPLSDTARTLR